MLNVSENTRSFWQDLRSKKIYLACSGGVDSMVLMHILIALKVDLNVIHVNYQLRGEASIQDAELVQSVCHHYKIPCEILRADLKKKLENGGNLQDEARKVRYNWFQKILANDPNNRIALAHHEDDQTETFFMNLARKSGIMGLACMKYEHNGIVRPLLDFSKAEILKYATTHSVQWREDRSNESNAYTRNRLRNEFIPFLKNEFPTLNSSISLLITRFQATQTGLEQHVIPIVDSIRASNSLPIEIFEKLSEWERVELLRQLDITASYASRILELSERGKQVHLNNSDFSSIVRDENQYTFLKTATNSHQLVLEEVDTLPEEFSKDVAYFDVSKIQGKLQVRNWEIGDRISPLGMKGSQLISDVIKDAKITADAKQNQLVVHDDARILWCVGLKISRNALPNDQTENILRCSIIVLEAEESERP
ncbi:MAG: tRNA lysidine(34) synthetase TilS [Fluviicola sp.]|nr:MAG: tRNA lysidine(34) synthetase TilS [Fluviicola sp.]